MISFNDATALLNTYVQPLKVEAVALEQALGRVLAAEPKAKVDAPPYTNSAMDGYAVRHVDICSATVLNPICLKCCGHIAAGAQNKLPDSILSGSCIEIMTGALVPPEFDTVIPVELTRKTNNGVLFTIPLQPKANIRHQGEDMKKDSPLIPAGTQLQPQHISLLASVGVQQIQAYHQPKVAIVTTGTEVITNLNQPLIPGQLYNSSAHYLKTALPFLGANICFYTHLKDNEDEALKIFKSI